MDTKFYHADNCNRTIWAGGFSFNFTPYEQVSTWMGVHAESDDKRQAALDKLVAAGKVTIITEEQYKAALKKKGLAMGGYSGSLAATTPAPGSAVVHSAAPAVVDTLPAPPEAEPVATVEEAIRAVPVERKKAA